MKKLLVFFASVFLAGIPVSATTTTNSLVSNNYTTFVRGYGNSFIFVEDGIEFAIFPDGQFDFNVMNYGPNFGAYADFGGVSISFNTGYGYDAYVQYDDFGAVIQIENVPIYYDYYGRIVRAGNVRIHYNNFGYVTRVGGLFVHYNAYNRFSHYTGYINSFNRFYVTRPWHRFYARPLVDLCIVFNRPYRRYYRPIRHTYYRPYRDNFRPQVNYSASRRNSVAQQSRRSDRYLQSRDGRRGNDALQRGRRVAANDQVSRNSRRNEGVTQRQRRDNNGVTQRSRRGSDSRSLSQERTVTRNRTSTPRRNATPRRTPDVKRKSTNSRPSVTSKPRTTSRSKVAQRSNSNRKQQQVKQRSVQRSKSSQARANRTSEKIRHKSRASSSSKPKARSARKRN